MRTLNEITDTIKESFVNDETMAQMYGLDASKTFDEQFSRVSFEAVLIYIVAMASYLCERLFLTTSDEVTAAIDSRYIASEPWFQQRAIEYQDGYSLIYNPATYPFEYAEQDEAARIVEFAAARSYLDTNDIRRIRILVSKKEKAPLSAEELSRFSTYMQRIAPAGTRMTFVSKQSDRLRITAQVNYDPLLLNSSGERITDGVKPVNIAVQEYIDGILYGGVFNKTKLVDAIQAAEGVVDVVLQSVSTSSDGGSYTVLDGTSYASTSGSFIIDNLNISYLSQDAD